jgi:hypothetical protein
MGGCAQLRLSQPEETLSFLLATISADGSLILLVGFALLFKEFEIPLPNTLHGNVLIITFQSVVVAENGSFIAADRSYDSKNIQRPLTPATSLRLYSNAINSKPELAMS